MSTRTFIAVAALVFSQATFADKVRETILFLEEDGAGYLQYGTLRSDAASWRMHREKGATFEDYLYFFPPEFEWDRSNPDEDVVELSQGSYAYLKPGRLETEISVDPNGTVTFKSWDGNERADGHFGYWTRPGDFDQFTYAWVLPENFELVSYQSNRDGKWVKRHNTIAFFGNDINNVTFTLKYRPRTAETYQALRALLGDEAGVDLAQTGDDVQVTLLDTVLFPSGSSELSEEGRSVIDKIARRLRTREDVRVVVQGHTDNVPIQGALAERFPTNWELSAARALAVVRHLSEAGFPGERLEVRAFGSHRPRASNASAEGRARNRRIELLISNR